MLARWLSLAALAISSAASGLTAGLGEPPPDIDRSTPAATVRGFLTLAHDGEYRLAAHYLNLDHLPPVQQPSEGARLARRLRFVLDRKLWLDFAKISHESNGNSADSRYEDL